MKKKLEAELTSIVHRVLQMKDKSDTKRLLEETRHLYEKLTVLHFSEQYFEGPQPTIGKVYEALETKEALPEETIEENSKPISSGNEISEHKESSKEEKKPVSAITPEPKVEVKEEDKVDLQTLKEEPEVLTPETEAFKETRPELIIEKINEKVSEDLFVPAHAIYNKSDALSSSEFVKNDMQDIGSYTNAEVTDKPKSLNDQLKKSIQIGLNDRLAFIKHLFDNSTSDYNRVLSQLNTKHSKEEAFLFVKQMVKPDHNDWQGKEEYEQRFMDIISNRFEA